MEEFLKTLPQLAKDKHKEHRTYFKKLKRKPPKDLDYQMQALHDSEFEQTDCLACANCCKTTGPLFTDRDIKRISRHFRMKEAAFIDSYLRVDEDGDHVLQEVPCTFLDVDNKCMIYEVRPKACTEFPHTDRKKFQQIGALTLKNVAICPAAFRIVEKMREQIPL